MNTGQWRSKKEIVIKEEIKKEASQIVKEFESFTQGYRVLFLLQRHKEGGETNNSKIKKYITNGTKEFQNALELLLTDFYAYDVPLRIYCAANARDMDKAIRRFRFEQLDAESYGKDQYHEFYLDIRNRFIGCLMQPGQRAESNFLWDIDTRDDMPFLEQLPPEVNIRLKYPTKQGWHIITEAFNYTKMVLPKDVALQKDGLLLLKFQVL